MSTYLEDVLSQPASLRQCLEGLGEPPYPGKLEALGERPYSRIVFTGMGSSNYCSIPADALLARHGRYSCRYSASELLHYHLDTLQPGTLLVLNSQSGESAEIVRLLERLPQGVDTVAVCNDPESTLAKAATLYLPISAQEEESVTTRTYLASIVIDLLIAHAYQGHSCGDFLYSILKVSQEMEELLQSAKPMLETLLQAIGFPPQLCLIGRGCSTATTQAGALFLREIARYPAFSELGGEFRHGPMEMVDGSFHGIIVAADDATEPLALGLAQDIQAHGGHVAAIAHRLWPGVPTVVVPQTDEWSSPLMTILPIQLYADSHAKQKGIRAGDFRWGSKITQTE